jgi:NhaC family Na+:H+ antiporter
VFVFLAASLVFGFRSFDASPHVPLLLTAALAGAIGLYNRTPWSTMQKGIADAYRDAAPAILIMLIIGSVIGTWIAGGIVPALIFYGLKVISPDYFLLATCLICSIASVATGSSWTTIGTIGLALFGIGLGMSINPAMTAGAIVSGAYFGDKMSPLSDTTNLAPAMAGVGLFEHIRHLIYTTGPAYLLALVLYSVLDFSRPSIATAADIEALSGVLDVTFNLSPWLLLLPLATMLMIGLKTPAIPGLITVSLLGALCAVLFQGAGPAEIVAAINDGYSVQTGSEDADQLLNRGGIQSMMWTVSLILIALAFAGVAERAGMISAVADRILSMVRSDGGLVIATIFTTIFTAMATGVQYIALIIPGRLYRDVYRDHNLHPKNLSRAMEDSGTVVAPLIPWGTDGAFITGVLGVSPVTYFAYAFFCVFSPIMSAVVGLTGWSLAASDSHEAAASNS